MFHTENERSIDMQIGCCWFDDERKELINQSNATTWQLNKNEYWVLSLLTKHRGQVVPIETLSFPSDLKYQSQISQTDLDKIVKNFKKYFGRSHKGLIEIIPTQGIILYNKVISNRSLLDSPIKVISNAQYIFIMLLTLIASFFVYSHLNGPGYVTPDTSRQFLTQEGNIANLHFYSSESSKVDIGLMANEVTAHLKACEVMSWDTISATMSEDGYAISLVLKKNISDKWIFHNIKINRDQINYHFVTPKWLKKVNICG